MSTRRAAVFAAVFVFALAGSKSLLADSLYLYTGNFFSDDTTVIVLEGPAPPAPVLLPYTTSDFISGFFETASPLPANLTAAMIVPEFFSWTDGVDSWTDGVTSPLQEAITDSEFQIWTDANGNIDHWYIQIEQAGGQELLSASDPLLADEEGAHNGMFDDAFAPLSPYAGRGGNFADPGTWETRTVAEPVLTSLSGLSEVPEPASVTLLATGALALLGATRRRLRA